MTFLVFLSWLVWSIDYRKRRMRKPEYRMQQHLDYCAKLRARKFQWWQV